LFLIGSLLVIGEPSTVSYVSVSLTMHPRVKYSLSPCWQRKGEPLGLSGLASACSNDIKRVVRWVVIGAAQGSPMGGWRRGDAAIRGLAF